MLPTSSSSSNRSLQSHKRNTAGRRQPVARSSSFLGAIKNIVTAPLSWFGQEEDDFEDVPGKRRRLGPSDDGRVAKEDGGSRKKRMRVSSPVEEGQPGYLDPPGLLFEQPRSAPPTSNHHQIPSLPCYPSSINRSTSVQTPSNSLRRMPSGVNRHTISPHRTSFSQADNLSRTMSMDPPARQLTRDITMTPSHDRFPLSVPREESMSPSRSPFRMRTSLTPQPSGSTFGPTFQHHRERASEPPTLEELMENPKFVRPPREVNHQRNLSREPTVTLGSLADSQRHTRSPSRQHSSLMFGPNGTSSGPQSSSHPINAAEKALHELDIYKTPLLPTRLRGSSTIPDMFKPKPGRSRTPFLVDSDRDQKPRLGRAKGKGKEEVNGTKPYAGEGGMRKLLARRRQEEEEENKAEAMDDGRIEEEDEEVRSKGKGRSYGAEASKENKASIPEKADKKQETIPAVPPVPKFDPSFDRNANREQSSLRVGRTRTSRNHISRPTSRSNNRFSAAYDDEEDDMMGEDKSEDQIALEEAAKKVPVFSVPAGFSFAKPETATIQHDTTGAKEPPMASLPFSLTQPTATASASTSAAEQPPKPASSFFGQPSTATPAKQPPIISLTAPTPETSKGSTPDTSSTGPSVPNFFANSAALNKPAAEAPPAPTQTSVPNFFANSAVLSNPTPAPSVPKTEAGIPNFFANSPALNKPIAPPTAPKTEAGIPNFFANSAALNKPAPATPAPTNFSFNQPTPTKDTENPLWEGEKKEKALEETKPSLFGGSPKPSSSSSLFGASQAPVATSSIFGASNDAQSAPKDAPPATSLFGGSSKPAESAASPFSFGAPSKPADPAQPPASAPEPPKAPSPAQADASKSQPLFGSAPISSFAGFGGSSSNSAETSKPVFTFGQPAQASSTTVEAPKPLFGAGAPGASSGFSFGDRPGSAPAAENRASSASPFSFGAAPATPPEKKAPFTFGASPVNPAPAPSSGFSFGPPSGSSNGTDVSHKPFSFGATTTAPPRPVTPKNDQEFRMEESPTRDVTQKADGPKPALGGFSFGAPSATSGSSPFGQNNQNGPASAPFSFGAPSASSSNPFGKPAETQDNKDNGFNTFGANTSSQGGFAFGQKAPEPAPSVSRSTSGGFAFGQPQPAAPPQIASSFSFGATPVNPFSQAPSNAGSAPNSPSTFNQPNPFSFASPTTPSNNSNPFAFGSSQPASPAAGNTNLPQAPGTPSGGFSFGQSNGAAAPQSTSPFQAQPALPPAGGNLFTIGSAPAPAPGGAGRPVKKLPRRGMSKR